MLNNANVAPTIPTTDLNRAREFFEKKLGLKAVSEPIEGHILYACGDTRLTVYQRPEVTPAAWTLCSFSVDDAPATIKKLQAAGVKFEEYKEGPFKTVDGVATMDDSKGGWFKDPDGNILAVFDGVE